MNKNIISIVIILTLLSGCSSKIKNNITIVPDYQKNHLQKNRIFGNVQEISTKSYFIDNIDTSLKKLLSENIQYYSPDGYLLKVIYKNESNKITGIKTISYHPNAKEDFWTDKDSSENILERCEYQYDIAGFIKKEIHYRNDSIYYSIEYKTDAVGNILDIVSALPNYSIHQKIEYDNNGLVIKNSEYDPNNKLFKYVTIEYDNYGDEVNRRIYQNSGKLIEYYYTKYDNMGRILEKIYEDRVHNYREDIIYQKHDRFLNWLIELKQIPSGKYYKEREYIYY